MTSKLSHHWLSVRHIHLIQNILLQVKSSDGMMKPSDCVISKCSLNANIFRLFGGSIICLQSCKLVITLKITSDPMHAKNTLISPSYELLESHNQAIHVISTGLDIGFKLYLSLGALGSDVTSVVKSILCACPAKNVTQPEVNQVVGKSTNVSNCIVLIAYITIFLYEVAQRPLTEVSVV